MNNRNKTKENLDCKINIVISISINKPRKIIKIIKTTVFLNQTLKELLNYISLSNNINNIGKDYYVYLKKNNIKIRELQNYKTISELNLKDNDEILITNKKFQIEEKRNIKITTEIDENSRQVFGNVIKYNRNNILNTSDNKDNLDKNKLIKKKKKFFLLIISLIFGCLIILGIAILIYIKLFRKENIEKDFRLEKEELIINKLYPKNILFRYSSIKKLNMSVNGDNFEQFDSKDALTQITDFFFIVRNVYYENDTENKYEKEWYIGYIGILNLTLKNKTHNMIIIYDKKMNNYVNQKRNNLINLNEIDLQYIGEDGNFCFIKIEFYKNGEIKKYYLPNGFEYLNFNYIEEFIKLIIPKLSINLYVKNIDESLNKEISLNNDENNKNDKESNDTNEANEVNDNKTNENEDEYLNNETIGARRRNLYQKKYHNYKKYKLYDVQHSVYSWRKKRKLSNSQNNNSNNTIDYFIDEVEIEEFSSSQLSNQTNIDLREANNNIKKNSNEEKKINYSNLTQFSIKGIKNDDATIEGSQVNTTSYILIDNNGLLESVEEITTISMNPIEDDENDDEKIILYNEIYNNNNNQISLGDVQKSEEDEIEDKNNDVKFNITEIYIINRHIINCSEQISKEKIYHQIYRYFDNFSYELYNMSQVNENINGNFTNDKIRNLENEDEGNSYYGIKSITTAKELYKYNLIGLKMRGNVVTEFQPSTGISKTYFDIIFGSKHTKINIKDQRTNLHIILEKKNQMGYNLILLLNKSNLALIERNKLYSEIILNMERNINDYFQNYYEYYNLFSDSLNDLYNQVKDFTGEFFYELIKLINITYYNYTVILDDILNNNYDIINNIRNITKGEYIAYIYEMIDILENFKNLTVIFLENIDNEINNVDDFQIDILYDIVDQIYESKQIFKQFNKNLFNSIIKGILTFKYNIKDYIDEIIGDLLYITDFLSVNINKNEILSKAIDEETRKDTSLKLKNFRNIIITIMDMLIDNINEDYNNEMSLNNNKSIKFYSYFKSSQLLSKIENRSNEVIYNIKSKINNINLYELYAENIDTINSINNKTNVEFINDIYNNIIYNFTNLKPEYFDSKSDIIENRNKLFDLSNNIISEINTEINDINNYIKNYINKYKEKNLYNIYKNLYYIRKNFLNDEMENLLYEFYLLVNETIKVHFKEIIDYNFNLIWKVFYEENQLFDIYSFRRRKLITSGFIQRKESYKSKFETFLYMTYSDQFLDLLEKYFYKLRDSILNHIKNKLISINKYYFDTDIYNNQFYFIEQTNNEILKFIDNINNYYNDLNLDGELKLKAFSIAESELTPYHNNKINEVDKYYEYLYSRTTHYHVRNTDSDFVSSYYRFFKGWKNKYMDTAHKNNINLVILDLNKTNDYLLTKTDYIINNFINKFDIYLNNYYSLCQNLFNNLYKFVEGKINTYGNGDLLMSNYKNYFNSIINVDSNQGLLERLYNERYFIGEKINYYCDYLKNNTNLLKNEYFNNHYINDSDKFLEYPDEIIYKINQFLNEITYNFDYIQKNINHIYKNKVTNIIKSTNNYIENYIKNDYNYILSKINSDTIIEKYYLSKYEKLKTLFNECLNNYKTISKANIYNDYILLNTDNYNTTIKSIINDSKIFISYLESLINQTFISEICDTIDNCILEKNKISQNYSKYNYNIVKLRTGIYYTKEIIENWNSLFEDSNFSNIIDFNIINNADKLLNDKNIIYIYNETNYKLNQLNKESILLIDEIFQEFLDEFKSKYTFKNDYLPFIKKFIELITLKDQNFNKKISDINSNISNYVYSLLDNFKKMYEKLSNTYGDFSKSFFKNIFSVYFSKLYITFQNYRNYIYSLNENYIFHNSIKNILRQLQKEKREYIKKSINDFSKNYNFELINMTYNLGEYIELFLEKEYDDYEFNYIYDYVEIFQNFSQIYINKSIDIINILENNITEELLNIYSFQVNISLLKEFKDNYLICVNYSNLFLSNENDIIELLNNENLNELINKTFLECFYNFNNETNLSEINNFTLYEKLDYIKNSKEQCFNYLSNYNINQTEKNYTLEFIELINCINNNFYNYTEYLILNYSEIFEIIIENITKEINNNYISTNFLLNFLENTTQLNPYEIDLTDFGYNFEGIENMINYVNNLKYNDFKNFLNNLLIASFNSSYINFVNNFIIDDLIDDAIIKINNKLELYISYTIKKIKDEYNYYFLILNNTDELGYSTKMAFLNLYENIKNKINETLYYLIEEDIFFYLDIFYRENKKMFINNFINYYVYSLNNYKIKIYKFSDFYEEIIIKKQFNETLKNISEELIYNKIIISIKDSINKLLNSKIIELYNIIDNLKLEIKDKLDNITTKTLPDDMTIINEIIVNFTKIVNNQNNRFSFKVSEKSFNIIYDFVHYNLEPPLILIKDQYNTIEEKLLNELIRIINEFPDFYEILRSKLKMDLIHGNISLFCEQVNELFLNYTNILDKEHESFINKLIHFTYINGLYSFDEPCNKSFCFINLEYENENITRNLEEEIDGNNFNNYGYNFNYIKLNRNTTNKIKNKKIRRLEEYNHTMGAIIESDIESFLSDLKDILFNFEKLFLGEEFKSINKNGNLFFNRINGTYILKLKRSIHNTALKFSTILTENSYNKLEYNIYKQYNDIVSYIYNNSNIINITKNNFIEKLDSLKFIEKLYNISYNRIKNYYVAFENLIQNKIKYISETEYKEYLSKNEKGDDDDDYSAEDADKLDFEIFNGIFKDAHKKTNDFFQKIQAKTEKEIKYIFAENEENKIDFEIETSMTMNSYFFKRINETSLGGDICLNLLSLKKNIPLGSFKLGVFDLAIQTILSLDAGICIELGFNLNWDEKEYNFFIDTYGKLEPSLSIDFGIYYKFKEAPIRISLNFGLKGIIISARAGMKLSLYMGEDKFQIDYYTILKPFEFSFYILLRFDIEIKITKRIKFSFSFQFYIFNKIFFGRKYDNRKIMKYKYNRKLISKKIKDKWLVETINK